MKAICTKLACFLLVLLVSGGAMAESITSPNGQLQLNFSVNAQGEPVYELSYKGKPVINPSKLGMASRWRMQRLPLSTRLGNRYGVK